MKLKGLTFRQKIFLSQVFLFFIFILILFPFVEKAVLRVVRLTLIENSEQLIEEITDTPDERAMIDQLKKEEVYLFFRVSLLNDKGELLYDSYLERALGEKFRTNYPTKHPEVEKALEEGEGYRLGYSEIFSKDFSYAAKRFTFHGKIYVLRSAFDFEQLRYFTHNFEVGFLIICALALIIFSALTWFIFARISKPISQIIHTIRPYQVGREEKVPEIALTPYIEESSDFHHLALAINGMGKRIQKQIESAQEEHREKEAILESLGEGVIAVDKNLIIRFVNFIGGKMLSSSQKKLAGTPLNSLKSDPLRDKSIELLQTCQEEGRTKIDTLILGKERKVFLDLIAAPIGDEMGAILVIQDMSSHHKAVEMGRDFIANASHELRTPITIVRGFAETLHDVPDLPTATRKEVTGKIVHSCERMESLVEKLLTLADIENLSESRMQKTDLISLVDKCLHTLKALHPEVQVKWEKNEEQIFYPLDASLMELAVDNLLKNAVKYSPSPAQITIELEEDDDEVTLSISDKGKGIPKEDQEHIFERFYTVNKAHSRKLGGAGLGLSIVKTIVEKHGGSVHLDSVPKAGSRFTIILPK